MTVPVPPVARQFIADRSTSLAMTPVHTLPMTSVTEPRSAMACSSTLLQYTRSPSSVRTAYVLPRGCLTYVPLA